MTPNDGLGDRRNKSLLPEIALYQKLWSKKIFTSNCLRAKLAEDNRYKQFL